MDIVLDNISNNIAASAVFDITFQPIFQCNNFGGTACNNTETITVPGPGTYFVQIQTYTDWANPVCNMFEEVTITVGSNRQEGINAGTISTTEEDLEFDTEEIIPSAKVFPNPAMGSVNIALADFQNKDVEIRVINTLGATIKQVSLDKVESIQHEIDLNGVASGIYTVVIFAEGQAPVSKKLIVKSGY